MAKKIYVIMTCNEWKEFSSMRIYAACSSLTKLRALLARGIEKNFFSYGTESISFKKQAKKFRTDCREAAKTTFPEDSLLALFKEVKYAHVFDIPDGEVQQD